MVNYKITLDPWSNEPNGAIRFPDIAGIPFAVDNTDYAQFKLDLSEGAELLDADGVAMTQAEVDVFLLTLP